MVFRVPPPLRPALAAGLLWFVACATPEGATKGDAPARGDKGHAQVGVPMPSIVVKRLAGGKDIDLSARKSKAVLIDIWASWCGPCKEEMPLLDEMAARLKPKGVEVIAVSIDEERDNATAFLAAKKQWTLTVAHDPEGKVPELLKPAKMPTSYLLDGEGIVRYVNEGFERADVAKLERRLLAVAQGGS